MISLKSFGAEGKVTHKAKKAHNVEKKDKIEQIPGWKIIYENINGPKQFVRGNLTIDIVKYTVILERQD